MGLRNIAVAAWTCYIDGGADAGALEPSASIKGAST
jgi:hypothetical protein